jgi:hypothetical protein
MQTVMLFGSDKEEYDWAKAHNFPIPKYRMFGLTHDGKEFSHVREFSPPQLSAITGAAYPECLTRRNCEFLISIWNKSSSASGYSYELLDTNYFVN